MYGLSWGNWHLWTFPSHENVSYIFSLGLSVCIHQCQYACCCVLSLLYLIFCHGVVANEGIEERSHSLHGGLSIFWLFGFSMQITESSINDGKGIFVIPHLHFPFLSHQQEPVEFSSTVIMKAALLSYFWPERKLLSSTMFPLAYSACNLCQNEGSLHLFPFIKPFLTKN